MVYNSHKSHNWYLKIHARVGASNMKKWELKCLNIKEEIKQFKTRECTELYTLKLMNVVSKQPEKNRFASLRTLKLIF